MLTSKTKWGRPSGFRLSIEWYHKLYKQKAFNCLNNRNMNRQFFENYQKIGKARKNKIESPKKGRWETKAAFKAHRKKELNLKKNAI